MLTLYTELPDTPEYLLHLGLAARSRVKTTVFLHKIAKVLEKAGAPVLKLSAFEVADEAFANALRVAGIGWSTPSSGFSTIFYWEVSNENSN